MRSKRLLSLTLSLLMIAGLLTAFPAFTASAESTNVALGKKYAYSLAPDNTIFSGTDYAFCETTQDEAGAYHTGYLTDGTKPQVRAGYYANPGWLGYINKVENVTFTVDLEENYDVSSVAVFLSWDDPPARLASKPTKLEVSYSADGATFASAEDIIEKYDTVTLYNKDLVTEYTKGHTHTTANAVSGVRYIRLTVSTPFTKNDAGQYVCRLYIGEFAVNAEKSGGSTATPTEISSGKKYAYSLAPDNTVFSGTDYAFCETTQDEAGAYHTGYLTDGTKPQVRAGYYANPGWLGYINKVENVTFTLDLEGKYDISSVAVFLSWDDPPARLASKPTKLEVSYSADGATFASAEDIIEKYDTVTLYNKDLVTEYTKGHTHTASNAVSEVRYVRLTVSTPFTKNDAGQYVCRLYIGEITVVGVPSESGPSEPQIAAPALSISNLTSDEVNRYGRYATYTIPTISWAAVENATSYDVYFNGEKVLADTTALSYTPAGIEPQRLYGYNGMRYSESVYVVAKGEGFKDSEQSETIEFLLVHKPTDKNGNEVESADFLIDPGHGGPQSPGACYNGREERYDTMNLAFKFGGYLEAAGYTVAYTRITDIFDNIYTKSAIGQAGDFKAFICNHRNANSPNTAIGCEYYTYSGSAASLELAKAIEAEMVADAIWKNRGCKTAEFVICKGNVRTPTTLIEIGFIDSDADNERYDTYFAETAQAIARGCINFIKGYKGYTSTIGETVTTDASAAISDTAVEGAPYIVSGKIKHGFGVSKVQFKLDNGEWKDTDLTTLRLTAEKTYEATIYDDLSVGTHTILVRGISNWDTTTKYSNTFDIATITLTVEAAAPKTYTVTFSSDENGSVTAEPLSVVYGTEYATIDFPAYTANEGYHFKEWQIVSGSLSEGLIVEDIEVRAIFEEDPKPSFILGDVTGDGEVDSGDAALILKYDAGIEDFNETQTLAGDTSKDGEVDSSDAGLILKYDAGIIDEF